MSTAQPNYPFSLTFYGKDIVEVRQAIVDFLADNVTPGVQTKTPQGSPGKKPRKTAKKKKTEIPPGQNGQGDPTPAVSADTDTAPETPGESPGESPKGEGKGEGDSITPEEHPNVSLAYNSALEQLMGIYNGSPEGAYEVTLLLEQYRVASFREIPEDRGVELLDAANALASTLARSKSAEATA